LCIQQHIYQQAKRGDATPRQAIGTRPTNEFNATTNPFSFFNNLSFLFFPFYKEERKIHSDALLTDDNEKSILILSGENNDYQWPPRGHFESIMQQQRGQRIFPDEAYKYKARGRRGGIPSAFNIFPLAAKFRFRRVMSL
jgi:hypothetical protein